MVNHEQKTDVAKPVANSTEEEDEADVGPAIPAGFLMPKFGQMTKKSEDHQSDDSSDDGDSDSTDDDEDDDDVNQMTLPISSSIKLLHGKKPISALALDPSGARLLTGGDDYNLKFWDFPGMTQTLEPFRYMEPQEGYHIRDLSYSVTGDNILVTTGSATPMLYDRDGFLVASCKKGNSTKVSITVLCQEQNDFFLNMAYAIVLKIMFVKNGFPNNNLIFLIQVNNAFIIGDNYLMDASKTMGHQAMCNGGRFHPFERGWFLTVANDGTVRQWDVEERKKDMFGCVVMEHFDVRKVRNKQGKRSTPTACTYDRQGRMIATGNDDGSIQIWDCKRTVAPKVQIWNAHKPFMDRITSVSYSYDNTMLASRSTDGTVKLWDLRKPKEVYAVREDLPARFDGTEVTFSPNDKLVLAGTSQLGKSDEPAKLVFMNRNNLEIVKTIEVISYFTCLCHFLRI